MDLKKQKTDATYVASNLDQGQLKSHLGTSSSTGPRHELEATSMEVDIPRGDATGATHPSRGKAGSQRGFRPLARQVHGGRPPRGGAVDKSPGKPPERSSSFPGEVREPTWLPSIGQPGTRGNTPRGVSSRGRALPGKSAGPPRHAGGGAALAQSYHDVVQKLPVPPLSRPSI